MSVSSRDWESEWVGVPEFVQDKQRPYAQVTFRFADELALTEFSSMIGQSLTNRTKSAWHPYRAHCGNGRKRWVGGDAAPKYPIYVVSKGRWRSRLTVKALEHLDIPYRIVVEMDEYENYASVVNPEKILVLPPNYQADYDTCDELGMSKSVGPGAARNFCWDDALRRGYKRHWVMDDNLDAFHRLNQNVKDEVESGVIFRIAEDFVDRYENVYVAGFNYYSFCKSTDEVPPYVLNTRIYSCLLIQNDIPYRWRGRYNEDTDLSLRVLKDGYCTLQFNAFLCGKVTTQRMSGGNTEVFYASEGTLPKSQMLADLHPDVAEVVWRFNRWHHHVNYSSFKGNKLIRKEGLVAQDGVDNYGMVLTELDKSGKDEQASIDEQIRQLRRDAGLPD